MDGGGHNRARLLDNLRTYQMIYINGGVHYPSTNPAYPSSLVFTFDHPTERETDGSVRMVSVSVKQNNELMSSDYREMRADYDSSGRLIHTTTRRTGMHALCYAM